MFYVFDDTVQRRAHCTAQAYEYRAALTLPLHIIPTYHLTVLDKYSKRNHNSTSSRIKNRIYRTGQPPSATLTSKEKAQQSPGATNKLLPSLNNSDEFRPPHPQVVFGIILLTDRDVCAKACTIRATACQASLFW